MGPEANRATRVASPFELINRAVGIIELADHRATATDGPVGHARDNMTDAEWRQLYQNLYIAREQLIRGVVGRAAGWKRRGQYGLEIYDISEEEAKKLDGNFVDIHVTHLRPSVDGDEMGHTRYSDRMPKDLAPVNNTCKRGNNIAQGLSGHWCTTHNAEFLLSKSRCAAAPEAPTVQWSWQCPSCGTADPDDHTEGCEATGVPAPTSATSGEAPEDLPDLYAAITLVRVYLGMITPEMAAGEVKRILASREEDLPIPRTREQHDIELGIDGHTHRFEVPLSGRHGCTYRDCFYTKEDESGKVREERLGD